VAYREAVSPTGFCPEEDDFFELYEVLGNRTKQEEIRQKNTEGLHCVMLQQSPTACDGCPNNPYNKNVKRKNNELVEEWQGSISRGLELMDLSELGLIDQVSDLTPEEVIILRSMLHFRKAEEMDQLSGLIASRLMGAGGKKTER
jgi:hypothetical protein